MEKYREGNKKYQYALEITCDACVWLYKTLKSYCEHIILMFNIINNIILIINKYYLML